jgi:thioredoxin reductase (NADPH)
VTHECDLLIVGGGPAGLSAAINGASEGLSICLLDNGLALGGQARGSASIENYPMPEGPHKGVTGERLMTGFVSQAYKFGADLICPQDAFKLIRDKDGLFLLTDDGDKFLAKSVILANGLNYRKHNALGLGPLIGRGVYYGMPSIPDKTLSNKTCAVIGGANSAGQAVLRLSKVPACKVKLIVRGTLRARMSQYLIDRIEAMPNVEIVENADVTAVDGRGRLEELTINGKTKMQVNYVFIYIGAVPRTFWLEGSVDLDDHGFINTSKGKLPFETSIPGVFAAGDVRSGSTKRIAAAIGEGSAALQMVHQYLDN